jgi:hypothetical protein
MNNTNTQIEYTTELLKSIYLRIKEEKDSRGGLSYKNSQLTLSPYLGVSEDYLDEYPLIKEWASITPAYLNIMKTLNFDVHSLDVYFALNKAFNINKHKIEPLIIGNFYTGEELLTRLQKFCYDTQIPLGLTTNDIVIEFMINQKLTMVAGTKHKHTGWYVVNK